MAINGIKGRKILSEVISSVITSSQKTVQKVGTETQEAAEKMPMPSASNILAYHQKSHPKAQLAQKLSPHEIYSLRKKELTDLAALRQCHERETLHISTFADQDAKKYNRIKEMIYLPLRGNSQISNTDLYKILDLSDEQYEIFSSLISIKGRKDKQFSCYDILEFIKEASKEQIKRAKALSYIDGRSEQFSFWQIEKMAKGKPEDFEKIKKLLFIPSRKAKQLDYDDISDVMCRHLNDNEFKNLYELLSHNPENSTPYAFCQIEGFLSNNKICKRLQELHCIKGLGDNSYSFPYIEHYAQLPDFQYKVAKRLLHIDKFKDKQLEFSEILEILKQNPEKIKKLLSYLDDKDLNTDSDIFCKLAQCQDTQPIVSMIKRCPHIPANEIVSLFKHSNKKVIEFIKPFLVNPKYNISKENGWICITNKQNNCSLSVYVRNLKNQEYFFERPLLNEKKEIAYIVKTKQGTFMDKWIAGIDESIGTGKNYRKLDNFPEKSTPEKIFSFLAKGDFKTSKVLDLSPEFCGHASFNLPQGSNSCKKVNGALVSELYIPQNKLPQRQTVHYPNGTIKTKDIGIGLSTSLEPNGNNNGMRIRKTLGKEKIDLSSFVEDNYVRIRDNLSGKEYNFSIYEFLEKGECHMEDIEIPFLQKREEVIKLFKKLSPTTLLNLIKYKRIRPKTIFPFIKNASEGEQRISSITLTKSPQITSHETLHGITDILDLPEDSQLIRLHAKEAAKSNGLLNVMSQYATGNHYDAKRGFEELVSIMGTMNEYGTEMAYRADATRLAFPETTKVIEKRLMDYYKRTINEMFK